MTILRMHGLDWNPNSALGLDSVYNGGYQVGISQYTSGGRFGGGHTGFGQRYGFLLIPNTQTVIVGFAFLTTSTSSERRLLDLLDGSTVQISVRINGLGGISVYRNTTLLAASGPVTLPTGAWNHLEVKAKIDNSTGTYEVRLNGVNILSAASQDTQQSTNAYVNKVGIFGSVALAGADGGLADDIVIMDDTGSVNNDFLGDCRIYTLRPTGAGSATDWTPSAGANWQCVDDAQANSDTDYVSSSTVSAQDLYAMGDLSVTPAQIRAVQTVCIARKTDAGAISAKVLTKSGSTTDAGSDVALLTSYAPFSVINETDPDTSAAWDVSGVNALEAGMEVS